MGINWSGVYPALTTKFHKDGNLDFQMFKTNLDAQIDAGVKGIILGGSLGEASTLSNSEKFQLLEKGKQYADGRLEMIVNIAESSTTEAIEVARQAEKMGADGLMALPPMQYKADDRETVQFFSDIASSTGLPIMLYNNPVDYGIEINLDMLDDLLKFDNIQAIKDSTRDLTNVTRMINRFGDRLKILCGVDTLAMDALIMGANGWVAGLVCAFPHETVAIYELVKTGRIEEALDLFRWFLPLLELDVNTKLVQNIKLAETATGIGTEYVRKPRLPLAGEERRQVQQIIDDALETRPEIPILKEVST